MRDKIIDTGFREATAADATADLCIPLTGAILAYTLRNVKLSLLLRAIVGLKGRLAVQFTNNALEWLDTPKELTAAYWNTPGWNRSDTAVNIFTLSGCTPRTFVRFVLLTQTPSGTLAGSAQVRARISAVALRAQRVPGPWSRVNTKGSDSSYAVHALTGAIDVMGYTEQRVMVELAGLTGGMGVTILTQQTNTPEDRTSWTDVATIGSELTAAGVTFPTTFSATAFTMRYGRWAAKVRNATAGVDVEACLVALVAEIRE